MDREERALFANEAFYLAFSEKSVAAMDRLWAKDNPTLCVHPGWPALIERDDIIDKWRLILNNPDQPGIDFYNAIAHCVSDVVYVTCYEQLTGSVCVATNGFIEEDDEFVMFHHHAGPCASPPSRF